MSVLRSLVLLSLLAPLWPAASAPARRLGRRLRRRRAALGGGRGTAAGALGGGRGTAAGAAGGRRRVPLHGAKQTLCASAGAWLRPASLCCWRVHGQCCRTLLAVDSWRSWGWRYHAFGEVPRLGRDLYPEDVAQAVFVGSKGARALITPLITLLRT